MNRYAAAGIANDARDGRRILVVTHNRREAHHAFEDIARLTHNAKRIRRTNGAERIDHHNGGSVHFTTPRSHGARGLTLDTIDLDTGVEPTPDLTTELTPCLATSRDGELIRA
ncbi:hypothetical protein [Microbacterium sp. MMO-56]|uniref:hypothetical protein n=1 Tax=Microbacterium sp. MMO-56 TaxID=3081281 RepID=UPI0030195BFB